MVGSIDPRCETLRGTHWPVKVAGVFGTRVAENHLGQRSSAASTGRTYGCKRSDQTIKKLLWHGGRPHMGPGVRRDDVRLHSITSSARASSVGGTSRPSALAVLRLMTSSNLIGCWIGSSPALVPLSTRST